MYSTSCVCRWYPKHGCSGSPHAIYYLTSYRSYSYLISGQAACVHTNGCSNEGYYPGVVVEAGSIFTTGPICTPSQNTVDYIPRERSSSSSSCFARTEMVQLSSGIVKPMKTVVIGDEILITSLDGKTLSYSPVIAIPHGTNQQNR